MTDSNCRDIVESMIPRTEKHAGQDLAALLRKTIRDSGLTRNRLSELSGVRYAPLWKFMGDERVDLTLASASKLLAALGLRVELRPAKRRSARKDK